MVGLGLTAAVLAGISAAWPADDAPQPVETSSPSTTLMTKEAADAFVPADGFEVPDVDGLPVPLPEDAEPADLFGDGPEAAVQAVLDAAGDPTQLLELTIYPDYLFVAYRDPAEPGHIDSRQWRGTVGDATPNMIDDRVDADTEPALFTLDELDLALRLLPSMIQDAVQRYDLEVEPTHVIIDRFLPFDERVLVRVYTTPTDGRSGGGYVTYTTAGIYQKTCC